MKQGIRTGLIGLVLVALAAGVAVAATDSLSASDGASASAEGSVGDQYGGASVQAGVQAQVGPVIVQAAVQASYSGRGWRGGKVKHCARKRGAKRSTCARDRQRLRALARRLRAGGTVRVSKAKRAALSGPLCTLPSGCAASAPVGVGGRSMRPISVSGAAASQALAVSGARVLGGPLELIAAACAALAVLALAATARRTLRRARASRD
jgi:hypothetical protein